MTSRPPLVGRRGLCASLLGAVLAAWLSSSAMPPSARAAEPAVDAPAARTVDASTAEDAARPATDDAATDEAAMEKPVDDHPRPGPIEAPAPEAIESALRRGVDFLLEHQNADGSWGVPDLARPFEVLAPVPGAHQAFRAATTSLCVSALVETGGDRPEVAAALDRGEAWLIANLPHVRRATPDTIYNVWAHIYSISALCHLIDRHAGDAARQATLRGLVEQQIDLLARYEVVDGGWGYYDFVAHTKQPSGTTMSFVTSAALVALADARRLGIAIPEKMIQRAKASILRQRKPDFSYLYGEYLKYAPMLDVNRPAGSLGRSQSCNLAMRLWGDSAVTDEVVKTWLDRIIARNLWLDLGRKRPIPHESWFHIAGYFFYYGHYYAGLCIDQLPEAERPFYQDHLAAILLRLQEKDGSWWDFPMFGYHQQYGTAFALMALKRCVRAAPAAAGS